jgi:hypothetical protein
MDEIQNKFLRYRSNLSPKFLWKDIMTYAEKRGTVVRNDEGLVIDYIPHNPGLITLIVIDHIGLIDYSSHKDLKEAIDQVSRSLVFFRNMFNFSPLVVVQSNRGSESMDRREDDNWMPMLSDIKNTNNLAEDANTVIGLASPFYYKVDKCLGYDITKFKDRYRLAKLLKNRDGARNLLISFLFIGEYGGYYQLPTKFDNTGKPEELRKITDYYKSLNNYNDADS